MSVSLTGKMRNCWFKISMLLMLLLTSLTRTAFCKEEGDADILEDLEPIIEENLTLETSSTIFLDGSSPSAFMSSLNTTLAEGSAEQPLPEEVARSDFTVTTAYQDEENLNFTTILIPAVLVVVLAGMIVCGIFITRQFKKNATNTESEKEDPFLDGSSTEKVPMPMFEDDVPSVLELEMDELDQWMKKEC